MLTLELFRQGMRMDELASHRGLALSTIENHLAQAIEAGEQIDPRKFYNEAEEAEMRAALEGYDEPALKPVYEQLGGRISYGKLRIFRACQDRMANASGASPLAC